MRRGITLMLQGNPYFAWQDVKDGESVYYPCWKLRQLKSFEEDIFCGNRTPGFYAIRTDNLTRWGGIDFDDHESADPSRWLDDAERAYSKLQEKASEVWLVESSPGCFHVITFVSDLVPAKEMRAMLYQYAPKGVEVFPKQDQLRGASNAKGSLMRFPGKNQLKGAFSLLFERAGRISDPANVPQSPKRNCWIEPSSDGRLQSLYSVCTRGIVITASGKRFHAMQRLAGRLKGRANNEAEARWIYTAWHNRYKDKIRTPLPEALEDFIDCYRSYEPCKLDIPEYPLSPAVEAALLRLPKIPLTTPEHLRNTARLLLQAKIHADKQGLPHFWLANRTIAQRLSCGPSTASRLRSACVALGIVEEIRRGHTGWATDFVLGKEWIPICLQ